MGFVMLSVSFGTRFVRYSEQTCFVASKSASFTFESIKKVQNLIKALLACKQRLHRQHYSSQRVFLMAYLSISIDLNIFVTKLLQGKILKCRETRCEESLESAFFKSKIGPWGRGVNPCIPYCL